MPTFSIPLSGLLSNEEALSVIGNNLANLNTTAYKSETPQFSDLFFQQLGTNGAGDPIQVGLGTGVTSTTTQFTQGNVQSTGVATDVAIQGDGFLQVQKGGVSLYTRDGSLSLTSQGNLVTQDGSNVMGYNAVNGTVSPDGPLVPLVIDQGQSTPPQATSNVEIGMNLDAGASSASATSAVGLGLNLQSSSSGTNYSTAVQVYDSQGIAHTLTYTFTNLGNDKWDVAITIPAADVGKSGSPVTIYDNTTAGYAPLTFPSGGGTLSSPASPVAIALSGSASLADGATLGFNWDPSGTTESSSASNATPSQTGGSAAGTFSTQVEVYDSLGGSHALTYAFTKTGPNAWAYQITMPAQDVGQSGSPV